MIKDKILIIRGEHIILDRDLAELYKVETRDLNKAVKRNLDRFPSDFMFQLTKQEFRNLKFKFGTSRWGGTRKLPFAFTEHGIAALSGILKSKKAVEVNIKIIRAFVKMRKFLSINSNLFQKFEYIDNKLLEHDESLDKVFQALEDKDLPKKGIFYNGQIFDAYELISRILMSAKNEIIIIDNYIDESVLILLSKAKAKIKIYTKEITKKLELDIKKYNSQYRQISVIKFERSHDRFLIIDKRIVYHFGASLKDLGKKWFAFSRLDDKSFEIIESLKNK